MLLLPRIIKCKYSYYMTFYLSSLVVEAIWPWSIYSTAEVLVYLPKKMTIIGHTPKVARAIKCIQECKMLPTVQGTFVSVQ